MRWLRRTEQAQDDELHVKAHQMVDLLNLTSATMEYHVEDEPNAYTLTFKANGYRW